MCTQSHVGAIDFTVIYICHEKKCGWKWYFPSHRSSETMVLYIVCVVLIWNNGVIYSVCGIDMPCGFLAVVTPRGDPHPPTTAHIYPRNRIVGDPFIPDTPARGTSGWQMLETFWHVWVQLKVWGMKFPEILTICDRAFCRYGQSLILLGALCTIWTSTLLVISSSISINVGRFQLNDRRSPTPFHTW